MAGSILLHFNSEITPERAESVEDSALVARLQAGSEEAYEALVERFQKPVYNLALRLIDRPGDAGDITQEVFIKVFRGVASFRGQSSLRTWIYRITVNEAHNRRRWMFRHQHNEVGLECEGDDDTVVERALPDRGRSPFDSAADRQKMLLIERALLAINPRFREAVVLRDIEDLSYEEIADILQISLGTVKSRILRGREALRRELTDSFQPNPAFRWMPKAAE
jgi:RNA polymerase sigma-70 factor, ECF subfamily